jgi:hypothetical protein
MGEDARVGPIFLLTLRSDASLCVDHPQEVPMSTTLTQMHHNFSGYNWTDEDRVTIRKWKRSFAIFYGLIGLLVVGFLAGGNYQTDMPRNAAAAASAATMTAINNNPAH